MVSGLIGHGEDTSRKFYGITKKYDDILLLDMPRIQYSDFDVFLYSIEVYFC